MSEITVREWLNHLYRDCDGLKSSARSGKTIRFALGSIIITLLIFICKVKITNTWFLSFIIVVIIFYLIYFFSVWYVTIQHSKIILCYSPLIDKIMKGEYDLAVIEKEYDKIKAYETELLNSWVRDLSRWLERKKH